MYLGKRNMKSRKNVVCRKRKYHDKIAAREYHNYLRTENALSNGGYNLW